jgi:hypothetical protein
MFAYDARVELLAQVLQFLFHNFAALGIAGNYLMSATAQRRFLDSKRKQTEISVNNLNEDNSHQPKLDSGITAKTSGSMLVDGLKQRRRIVVAEGPATVAVE